MKSTILVILLTVSFTIRVSAEDDFIQLSTTMLAAGKRISAPTVTSRSGVETRVSCPLAFEGSVQKTEILITSTATIEKSAIRYNITTSIPAENMEITKATFVGTTDNNKPIVFEFQCGGKAYGIKLVFAKANSDGTTQ